jgi:hypothetical protein
MSKTQRNHPNWKKYHHRRPKTTNEIRQNQTLLNDLQTEDYPYNISGVNRLHRFIPTAWDDMLVSSTKEKVFPDS